MYCYPFVVLGIAQNPTTCTCSPTGFIHAQSVQMGRKGLLLFKVDESIIEHDSEWQTRFIKWLRKVKVLPRISGLHTFAARLQNSWNIALSKERLILACLRRKMLLHLSILNLGMMLPCKWILLKATLVSFGMRFSLHIYSSIVVLHVPVPSTQLS